MTPTNGLTLPSARAQKILIVVAGEADELRRLRAREAILDFLSGWSSRLHQVTDRAALAQLTREAVRQTTPYRQCWIYVMPLNPTGTEMELILVATDQADVVVREISMLPTDGDAYMQEVLTSVEPAIVIDAQTDPRVNREIVDLLGNRTIINVPLRLLDRRVGALGAGTFGDEGVIPPSAQDIWALKLISQQLVVALSRQQIETERAQARQERERLQAQFLQAQKLESVGLLAGGVAHDFNNLMVGVLGNASLARDELGADGPAEPLLLAIEVAAQRASELANQMLSYAGRNEYTLAPVDLGRLLHEMLALLTAVIPRSVKVEVALPERAAVVQADATQLRQVIMNLVTNAAQAIGDRPGRIGLVVEPGKLEHAAAWRLRVQDSGCGMSPEVQAHIFDPFFTTKAGGHGLGMAAVLGIVRAHGGEIHVDSAPERGTTFEILLPASTRSATSSLAGPPVQPQTIGAGGQILVVDDEELIRTLAKRLLGRLGFDVAVAEDGEAAMSLLAHPEPWSCVLMDLAMPKLGGRALYRAVRAHDPEVPILLSSGRPPEWPWQQEQDPNLAFIAKPYRSQALVDALSVLMAGRGATTN